MPKVSGGNRHRELAVLFPSRVKGFCRHDVQITLPHNSQLRPKSPPAGDAHATIRGRLKRRVKPRREDEHVRVRDGGGEVEGGQGIRDHTLSVDPASSDHRDSRTPADNYRKSTPQVQILESGKVRYNSPRSDISFLTGCGPRSLSSLRHH